MTQNDYLWLLFCHGNALPIFFRGFQFDPYKFSGSTNYKAHIHKKTSCNICSSAGIPARTTEVIQSGGEPASEVSETSIPCLPSRLPKTARQVSVEIRSHKIFYFEFRILDFRCIIPKLKTLN